MTHCRQRAPGVARCRRVGCELLLEAPELLYGALEVERLGRERLARLLPSVRPGHRWAPPPPVSHPPPQRAKSASAPTSAPSASPLVSRGLWHARNQSASPQGANP